MASPKDTYTFSSSRENCDYERILRENPKSDVIVLTRKNSESPTITLVRTSAHAAIARLTEADKDSVAYITKAEGWGMRELALVYIGDVHVAALGIVETKVEAY